MEGNKGREQLHERNLRLVLQQIFNHKMISRIEISRHLKLYKSTVSTLYNELSDKGYVEELGRGKSTSVRGRKPALVAFNAHYGYTLNFVLGLEKLHVMANYLNGDVLFTREIEMVNRDIYKVVKIIDAEVESSLKRDQTDHGLLGIGFAVHGIVSDNRIISSPFMNMAGIELVSRYAEKYGVPVHVDNEANLLAIYHRDFNRYNQSRNLLAITVDKGFGAGIILNNQLYQGYGGAAGEIGQTIIYNNCLNKNQRFRVDDICSERAVIAGIKNQLHENQLDVDRLAAMRQAGNPIVCDALGKFAGSVASLIFNVASVIAPEKIYLTSPILSASPSLFKIVTKDIRQLGMQTPILLTIRTRDAIILGCCSAITHQVLGMDGYELTFRSSSNRASKLK